jgi:hypothetical protein
MSTTSTHQNQQLQELELLKIQSDTNNDMTRLHMVVPANQKAEDRKYWTYYFRTLLYGFDNGLIGEADIPHYIEKYSKVQTKDKEKCNTLIYDMFNNKIIENSQAEEVVTLQEMEEEIEAICAKLDEKTAFAFRYFMNTGEEMPADFEQQVQEQLQAQRELEAYERLQGVLSDKNTLNIGARTVVQPRTAQGMTSEELAARFGLEQGAVNEYEIDPETGKYMTPEEFAILKKQREDAATAQKPQTIYQQVQQARARQTAPQPSKPLAAKTTGTLETLLK